MFQTLFSHSYFSIQSIQCTLGNNFNPAHFDIILGSVTKQMYGENKVESISVYCSVQFALTLIVWFQKVSIPTPLRVTGNDKV